VPEGADADPTLASPGLAEIDSFLIQHIRDNPGTRFGAIVQAAQSSRRISRAAAAKHLSRLVRFGDVRLLPDHTYIIGESTASTSRATTEDRWLNQVVIIRPDGSARLVLEQEFRVVLGQLDHLEFVDPKAPRQFIWWCTAAGHLTKLAAMRAPTRLPTHNLGFTIPLTARNPAWQRVCQNLDLPHWYRMAYSPRPRSSTSRGRGEPEHESESITYLSQDRRLGHRLTSDAHLRLQVVLPEGYPVGPARFRVHFVTEPGVVDSAEEMRLAKLGDDESRQEGFRRAQGILTLSVPRPRLDRRYEIEWTLPTTTERSRWLTAESRRLSGLARRTS
jgi:hypothetical protein